MQEQQSSCGRTATYAPATFSSSHKQYKQSLPLSTNEKPGRSLRLGCLSLSQNYSPESVAERHLSDRSCLTNTR